MRYRGVRAALDTATVAVFLLAGCTRGRTQSQQRAEIGPAPEVRIALASHGLPGDFFQPVPSGHCDNQIIGYRFVVWLDSQDVAVGFNTSPSCRPSPGQEVKGNLRILEFNLQGKLLASRDLAYDADGKGELVADGEAMQGPGHKLAVGIEGTPLSEEPRRDSPSGVELLGPDLKDVLRVDGYLKESTLGDHAIILEDTSEGFAIIGGTSPHDVKYRYIKWPIGAGDRKVEANEYAFLRCSQEVNPGSYSYSNVVYAGARLRCALNVVGDSGTSWTVPLKDGESAELIGLLPDGDVVGVAHAGNQAERLVEWTKSAAPQTLPWLPQGFDGTVDSSSQSFSRYASVATSDSNACNPLTAIIGGCDANPAGRLFIFDRDEHLPLVDRALPGGARASLSPDGLHYAAFESNELRIYSLPDLHHN